VPELPDGLSISDLARRTQVPAPTLRSWEDRYGFPRPRRLAGGHRRYDDGDVAIIEAVVRLRASGMSMQAAISQATSRTAEAEPSVFAGLRRRHPAVTPRVLRKVTLLALTRAIEDECCARAERPVLFAGFQQQRYFRRSEERWNELARTAQIVVVFADFIEPGGLPPEEPAPIRVPLPQDAPARREWTLVCASTDYPACVTGWEFPGQREAADADRRFEVIWSVDPEVVSDAAAICARLARSILPELGPLLGGLPSEPAPPASADLRRAEGLLSRMTEYLEKAAPGEVHPGLLPARDTTPSSAPLIMGVISALCGDFLMRWSSSAMWTICFPHVACSELARRNCMPMRQCKSQASQRPVCWLPHGGEPIRWSWYYRGCSWLGGLHVVIQSFRVI
jgi:MerR family transcriptional regulator, light-induced transcriptional regulator